MDMHIISNIFLSCIHHKPQRVTRCSVGIGNQVYIVECDHVKYILRCSTDDNAYSDTVHWLTELSLLDVPVPKVLHYGKNGGYSYLILNYIRGEDIGLVYPNLSKPEKRAIAKNVMEIQRKVSLLQLEPAVKPWSWIDFPDALLARADLRIRQNGYFSSSRVEQLKKQIYLLEDYFSEVKPIAYLDDISTKNLLIHNGQLSGIIDIDWMGMGDSLTFIALTYVALMHMDYDTDYAEYLLEEKGCSDSEQNAFLFYCLMYCVDFMGERGMQFGDKKVDVNDEIIGKLNHLYDVLWEKWCIRNSI